MSADGLCKTLSAKKPKKFTVCYSVPNKDGKQALLAKQLFQPKHSISLHLCISQRYRTATLFAANAKIAFKGRFQYFAAKGSHIPNKFSPNLDRAVLPYFRPASSPGKSVMAHFNLKTSPQHTTRLYYRSQRSDTRSRTSRAVVLDLVKLNLRVWFLFPFLARSRLGAVTQLCHRMSQPQPRRKAQGQRRVPSEVPHFAAAN